MKKGLHVRRRTNIEVRVSKTRSPWTSQGLESLHNVCDNESKCPYANDDTNPYDPAELRVIPDMRTVRLEAESQEFPSLVISSDRPSPVKTYIRCIASLAATLPLMTPAMIIVGIATPSFTIFLHQLGTLALDAGDRKLTCDSAESQGKIAKSR